MGMLTPDGYRRLAMPDLVKMTWDRIETLEREHYGLLLLTVERGRTDDDDLALDEIERRRDVQLARLMPENAHDEVPGERTESPNTPDGDGDGDETPADEESSAT